jgi:hypothetical protein
MQIQSVEVRVMLNGTRVLAEASDSVVFASITVVLAAACGFLAYMIWEPSREEAARVRGVMRGIGLRMFSPFKRLSPGRWVLVLSLIGVFGTAWWLVTRDAAEELERAERGQKETVNSRMYPPRSEVLLEAGERVTAARSRYSRDNAVGFGVGLSAVVLSLAGVVLWQRVNWGHAASRPGNKGDEDSATASRGPHV